MPKPWKTVTPTDIGKAMERYYQDRTMAARALGISRETLKKMIWKYPTLAKYRCDLHKSRVKPV